MSVTPEMKALIAQAGFVSKSNGGMYKKKGWRRGDRGPQSRMCKHS